VPRPLPSTLLAVAAAVALTGCAREPDLAGSWRAALELAGGTLPFSLEIGSDADQATGEICNASACNELSAVRAEGDSLVIEIADYDARIFVRALGDSLIGTYRNVGNRGPRAIPFHASRGEWESVSGPEPLLGRWDAVFVTDQRRSPRVFEFRNGDSGLEASFQANSGDYGLFWGRAVGDSFAVSHFDGSFVYLLAGRLDGDTLRGTFHAGLRTQTPFVAWRSTGARHLVPPTELTSADTTRPFEFAFPDLDGQVVRNTDPRFAGKVVVIDIFGTWCPTCHDAAPALVDLYDRYHDRGLEVLGFAYEVTGDSAIDNRQIRRFRDKFDVPYPLLRAGLNVVEETAATLPQLTGFTAYPTTVFLGRDGKVKAVYAGFRGPATGAQYERQLADYDRIVEDLLAR